MQTIEKSYFAKLGRIRSLHGAQSHYPLPSAQWGRWLAPIVLGLTSCASDAVWTDALSFTGVSTSPGAEVQIFAHWPAATRVDAGDDFDTESAMVNDQVSEASSLEDAPLLHDAGTAMPQTADAGAAESAPVVGTRPASSSSSDAAPPGDNPPSDSELSQPTSPVPQAELGAEETTPAGVESELEAGEVSCWSLPVVDTVRLLPAAGRAEALIGGRIEGSNLSETNGFETLLRIEQLATEEGWLELSIPGASAFRYIKYHAPAGSAGGVAELSFSSEGSALSGHSFGTGADHTLAFDTEPATSFEGALSGDNYVGLDLGHGHVMPEPQLLPKPIDWSSGDRLEMSLPDGGRVLFTLDGSDPRNGEEYREPVELPEGTTVVRAMARKACRLDSPPVSASYTTGDSQPLDSSTRTLSTMHIGNSLTDTLMGYFVETSLRGGVTVDFHRYTIPGAGLWLYENNPTGGNGVADVQEELLTVGFEHVVVQPYPNLPCQPVPSEDGDDNDGAYVSRIWADARQSNPDTKLWIYQQWPGPVDFTNCFSGGEWIREGWSVPESPHDWQQAVLNELSYHRAVQQEVARLNPELPVPRIVPVGQALVTLLHAIEAGEVPGVEDFWSYVFQDGGRDVHLTPAGSYFVAEVFYTRLFERDPRGKEVDPAIAISDEQAQSLQSVAWRTVVDFASEEGEALRP